MLYLVVKQKLSVMSSFIIFVIIVSEHFIIKNNICNLCRSHILIKSIEFNNSFFNRTPLGVIFRSQSFIIAQIIQIKYHTFRTSFLPLIVALIDTFLYEVHIAMMYKTPAIDLFFFFIYLV